MLKTTLRFSPILGFVLLLGVLLLAPSPASACMTSGCSGCPSNCNCTSTPTSTTCDCSQQAFFLIEESPQTSVTFLDETRVRVVLRGYLTTQFLPANDCVTAFPPLESVASVDSVVNIDGRSGRPFEEVQFYPSAGPGSIVAERAIEEGLTTSDDPWHTFQSLITGTVEDGVPNHFILDLTLKDGVDPWTFLEELKASGSFLTSGSEEDGTPNHHTHFRQIGAGSILVGLGSTIVPPTPQFPGPTVSEQAF